MRKNYVVFGPTSGRGISKTKALFDCLSLHYKEEHAIKEIIITSNKVTIDLFMVL